MLVTKAISCNHSCKVLLSMTSAYALISGLDPSACLVLVAIVHLLLFGFLSLKPLAHHYPHQLGCQSLYSCKTLPAFYQSISHLYRDNPTWFRVQESVDISCMLGAVPNKQTDLASWINLGPTHFIICIFHNNHLSKNSQMFCVLCIYSKKIL